jgi:acetyl esterase/lipase
MASPQLADVLRHLKGIARRSNLSSGDMVAARGVLDEYASVDDAVHDFDARVEPIEVDGVACEWIQAPGADPNRRLLYIHGGGWTAGSLDSHRPLSARISAASGCAVLAVDYRLAPENAFPAGLEDCLTAYQWVRENGPGGPGATTSVFIAGDSAGGNLTLCTLLASQDRGIPLPNAAIPLSAATDLTGSGESFQTRADVDPIIPSDPAALQIMEAVYCQGNAKLDDPLVSPLFGDLAGLPPLLIQVGDAEVLLSDSTRLAERAKDAGVDVTLEVWDEMPHVWQAFAGFLPEADEAIERIGAFVRAHG